MRRSRPVRASVREASNPSDEHQAQVVVGWPTATELSDARENGLGKVHDGSRVPCPQHLLDARLPELFAVAVSRLDKSVREDGEKVAVLEREAPDVTTPVLEKAERRRRRLEPLDGSVPAQNDRRCMTAVDPLKLARRLVPAREEECRVALG